MEVFSNDISVKCSGCGFIVYNDIESCIQWCRHAKECVGEEMYRKLMEAKKSSRWTEGEVILSSDRQHPLNRPPCPFCNLFWHGDAGLQVNEGLADFCKVSLFHVRADGS